MPEPRRNRPRKPRIRKTPIVLGVIAAIVVAILIGWSQTGSGKRLLLGIKSDLSGGSERTATLYDNTGKKIKSWTGKIDASESEKETYFVVDGKPVLIHGGITVIE